MALLSKTSIFIAGKEVPSFKRLYLDQQIDAHHTLEIVFRMDMFEKDSSGLGEKSKEFLGEAISIQTISISDKSKLGKLEFKGIVTEINVTKGDNIDLGDEIVLIAKSPTIRAEDGAHYNCFSELSLDAILNKTLNNYNIDSQFSSRYSENIDYCVQQDESCFQFVSRLAAQYGEWFYYNGEKLIFGKPETEETELRYNIDLLDYNLTLIPQSQNYNYYTNDYLTSKIEEDHASSKPSGASAVNSYVYNKSNEIFNIQTNVWNNVNTSNKAKDKLKSKAKAQKEAIAIKQVKLSGSSDNPGVKLGNLIKIEGEKYRVIDIEHFTNRDGEYQNKFEAISGSFDAYPKTNINAFPISQSQIGIVTENADPDGMGRIKVTLPWQSFIDETTPWIRIVSPHTSKDQGFHFIPEIGDEVLVDFEGGNAEAPYVLGSLYHEKHKPDGAWKTSKNDIKAIKTRGGHLLEFKDEKGKESITISDKKGNTIVLDTKGGNITINASNNLTLNAGKDISINAGNDLKISAGNNTDITSQVDVAITAGANYSVTAGIKAEITAVQIGIKGDATAKLEAPMVDIDGKAMTNVKGGIVNLN